MRRRIGRSVVAVLLAAGCPLARAETASDWEWTVVPYLWGPSVSLDVTANNDPVIGVDASFSDLLDKLDLAAAVHFEGRCEHAGFFVDALFVDVGAEQTNTARPPLPGGTLTEVDMKVGTFEAAGFYRPGGRAHGLDLILGARMFDYRTRIDVTIPAPFNATTSAGSDKNFVDAFAGVRYTTPIGKRWHFVIRGDAGGGGTDLSWNAVATFGVRLGKTGRYNLAFGWHHMELNVTAKNPQNVEIESNQTLTGPFVGLALRF